MTEAEKKAKEFLSQLHKDIALNDGIVDEASIPLAMNRKSNFTIIPNPYLDREDLTAYEKLLYITLYRFCFDGRPVFPKIDRICKMNGISKSTFLRTLKSLNEKGAIHSVKRFKNEKQISNFYYLADISETTGAFLTHQIEHLKNIHSVYLDENNKVTKTITVEQYNMTVK